MRCERCQREMPPGEFAGDRRVCRECGGGGALPPAPAGEGAVGSGRVRRRTSLSFTGRGGEYFRIWAVNVLLTVLTLGIYSAWAKVRTHRYFYGNTWFMGRPFEYLARPGRILLGRLIVVGFVVGYNQLQEFIATRDSVTMLLWAAPLSFVPLFVFPWLMVKALSFRTRYSAHRNIRFGFAGGYGRALYAYVVLPFVALVSLGIGYPAYVCERKRYVASNLRYGTAHFGFLGTSGGFYAIFAKAVGIVAAGGAVLGGGFLLLGGPVMEGLSAILPAGVPVPVAALLLGPMGILVFVAAYVYVRTATTNYFWDHVRLGENRFSGTLEFRRMLWLFASNALAVALTAGLMYPWARVRMTRYLAENIRAKMADDMDEFAAAEEGKVSPIGEEAADFFDFDFGI